MCSFFSFPSFHSCVGPLRRPQIRIDSQKLPEDFCHWSEFTTWGFLSFFSEKCRVEKTFTLVITSVLCFSPISSGINENGKFQSQWKSRWRSSVFASLDWSAVPTVTRAREQLNFFKWKRSSFIVFSRTFCLKSSLGWWVGHGLCNNHSEEQLKSPRSTTALRRLLLSLRKLPPMCSSSFPSK